MTSWVYLSEERGTQLVLNFTQVYAVFTKVRR